MASKYDLDHVFDEMASIIENKQERRTWKPSEQQVAAIVMLAVAVKQIAEHLNAEGAK